MVAPLMEAGVEETDQKDSEKTKWARNEDGRLELNRSRWRFFHINPHPKVQDVT